MTEFVSSPRRTPRASIGCGARVALRDGRFFTGETLDCGPHGCQIVSPTPLERDARVFVELTGTGVEEPCWASGRVAWTSDGPPFRAGVHFDAGSARCSVGFFFKLADANPSCLSRTPSRLCSEARIVPRRTTDQPLRPVEDELLRAVGMGIRVCELREKLGGRWEQSLSPLFSLLANRTLEVEPESVPDTTA